MLNKLLISLSLAVTAIILGCENKQAPEVLTSSFHQDLLVIDSHIDIPLNFATPAADPGTDSPMQVDLVKMGIGGLDGGFFIVYTRQGPLTAEGFKEAYTAAATKFAAISRMAEQYPDQIGLATSAEQVRSLHAAGKKIALIGVENGYSLGADIEHLDDFHARGARYISLTHFGNNQLADSSGNTALEAESNPGCNGICPLGKTLISRLNQLGIMVDVSHSSKESTLQAAALSRAPIIASHSALRAFQDIPRNISDEEIKAIAAKGGVIQLVAFDSYIQPVSEERTAVIKQVREQLGFNSSADFAKATELQKQQLRQAINSIDSQQKRATVANLVDQIDYVVKLVGEDYAGIASDFGGGGGVTGWDDASETAAVTEEMIRRGYSEKTIEKIWSGNLLRVMQEVENIGQQLSAQ